MCANPQKEVGILANGSSPDWPMTEPQLLDFVDWSIDQLERQLAEANRQRDELHDFVSGRRRSKHRLGSIYYLGWGQWLDAVARTTTEWESRYL